MSSPARSSGTTRRRRWRTRPAAAASPAPAGSLRRSARASGCTSSSPPRSRSPTRDRRTPARAKEDALLRHGQKWEMDARGANKSCKHRPYVSAVTNAQGRSCLLPRYVAPAALPPGFQGRRRGRADAAATASLRAPRPARLRHGGVRDARERGHMDYVRGVPRPVRGGLGGARASARGVSAHAGRRGVHRARRERRRSPTRRWCSRPGGKAAPHRI